MKQPKQAKLVYDYRVLPDGKQVAEAELTVKVLIWTTGTTKAKLMKTAKGILPHSLALESIRVLSKHL